MIKVIVIVMVMIMIIIMIMDSSHRAPHTIVFGCS